MTKYKIELKPEFEEGSPYRRCVVCGKPSFQVAFMWRAVMRDGHIVGHMCNSECKKKAMEQQ